MKTVYIILLGVAATACSSTLTYDQAMQKNDHNLETEALKNDAQFLVEAKSLSILEQELAKLATTAAYSAKVQTFAESIVNEHSEMNDEIDDLASNYKIKVPEEMSGGHRMKYETVLNSSREDFDKAFLDTLEDIYQSNIDLYESYATTATLNELRAFAAARLGMLRTNEQKADDLEDDLL